MAVGDLFYVAKLVSEAWHKQAQPVLYCQIGKMGSAYSVRLPYNHQKVWWGTTVFLAKDLNEKAIPRAPLFIYKRNLVWNGCEILCQLINCRSFELYSVPIPDHPDYSSLVRLTDAIMIILDIFAEGYMPLLSFVQRTQPSRSRWLCSLAKINKQDELCTGLSHLKKLSLSF